jgi:SulP family sulfate permease
MPSRRDAEQQLPFTGDSTSDADFAQDLSHAENGGQPQSRPIRAHSISAQALSGSYTGSYSRNPIRSFAHQTSHGFAGTTMISRPSCTSPH